MASNYPKGSEWRKWDLHIHTPESFHWNGGKRFSEMTEVEVEQQLKDIVSSSDGFILNENVRNHGSAKKSYYQGTYSIKVASDKYDAVVSQLKGIGEVQSFTENAKDITGSYTNLEIEINTEKSRLQRYEQLYNQLSKAESKKDLIDDIFEQVVSKRTCHFNFL